LNRGSLFGPLIGKVKLYLKDMVNPDVDAGSGMHSAACQRSAYGRGDSGVKRYPGAALLAQTVTPGGQPILRRQPMKAVIAWRASDMHMVSAK
jgi:hypothetical protein